MRGPGGAGRGGMVVGIDASRNRSGGAKAHLVGILTGADPREYGIDRVHVWAYRALMDAVPDFPWLVKHMPDALARGLPAQVWWQWRHLPREARAAGCDILFNTDAGSVCPFEPGVTMSQDMLSYEPGEMRRYGLSKARLRLWLLRHIQNHSLRTARAVVFLTEYARTMICRAAGPLKGSRVINHGIGEEFRYRRIRPIRGVDSSPARILYVSNAAPYKHQWHVVDAVARLRGTGRAASLLLVGGGKGPAQARLEAAMDAADPRREFVEQKAFVEHGRIPVFLAEADVFVFASSCENMPITLMEAMAAGLPIACSDRGPMPEVLGDAGLYFDPENPGSIAAALGRILGDPALAARLGQAAMERAARYSWERCAAETWDFLCECVPTAGGIPRQRTVPQAG